ncbi:Hypothetical predicted protein [Cloeon dipterum]|uniref:Cytochrome P450 n=1 Tax=Cloeon dipterum TaxID=197152 RepID=A0A8S1BZD3_9INSE|nr:Hypothetical predicted protein [Cloeon dipterum]
MDYSWLATLLRVLLLFVAPLVFLTYKSLKHFKFVSIVDRIPGPWALPLIGNAPLMMRLSLSEMFQFVSTNAFTEFGHRVRFWLVDRPHVMITKASDCEKIMKGMQHHMKSLNYDLMLKEWMGEGLLTSKDDKWRVHRKILTPAFHFNILHEFLPILSKNSKILVEQLSQLPEYKSGKDFNIFETVSLCALDIICESSMGTVINAQKSSQSPYVQTVNKLNELVALKYFSPRLRFNIFYKFSKVKRDTDYHLKVSADFTDKVIRERRQYLNSLRKENEAGREGEKKHLAFLDMLLDAEMRGEKYMTDKDLRDQVSTFMFEGHDTVTTGTCWALFMLGTHPEIQEKVVEELDQVFGDTGRAPTINDIAELKLLERCVKESQRLYPSVPFYERHLREDAELDDGTVIPAGCSVGFSVYRVHRDPEQYPDPEKFDPDRFLPENAVSRHPYAYLPFSAGPRNCIGQKFALLEEKVVISTMLRKFRVEAAHKPEDAELQMALVLRPKNGLRIRLYERTSHPHLAMQD